MIIYPLFYQPTRVASFISHARMKACCAFKGVSFKCLVCLQGNIFDKAYNSNKTLLRYISRWMVAMYDDIDYNTLAEAAHDIDNVLTITIPEVEHPSAQVT